MTRTGSTFEAWRSQGMAKIKLNVPPDQTPEEEAALVAQVATAISETTGAEHIEFELNKPEEVDYQAVSQRTEASKRWS